MASVGRHDTGPEVRLRHMLHRLGLRYRLHDRKLPGSPDLVFPRFRAVIFVHGCFWHGHDGCKFATRPSSNEEFWIKKFKANHERDKRNCITLTETGWRVLVIWECAVKGRKEDDLKRLGEQVLSWLKSDDGYGEIAENGFQYKPL